MLTATTLQIVLQEAGSTVAFFTSRLCKLDFGLHGFLAQPECTDVELVMHNVCYDVGLS